MFLAPTACGSPDIKTNSTIASPYAYKVSSVIEYVCPEGHSTTGLAKRTCGANGFWTGAAPACKCTLIITIEPGEEEEERRRREFVFNNFCFIYTDVDCGPLNGIENGTVVLEDNRTTFRAIARYVCNLNYSLSNGDAKRTCADDGIWTGRTPQCLCKFIPNYDVNVCPGGGMGIRVNR